jgi:hypothetical protein
MNLINTGQTLPPRTYAAGTILLYKALRGDTTVITKIGNRVIQKDTLSMYNDTNSKTLRRLGTRLLYTRC